ncbi:hypothetical protein M8J77_003545 [Diaphorina citri]|nr:hypothetical protein M8J77_017835 [Diaphorina citri]KAI5738148.1 hypothetical protein M8J77_003545 [Diaphorina citri]
MAPTLSEQLSTAVKNRERYFQRVQLCFDLIKTPHQEATFLARCNQIKDTFNKFEEVNNIINSLNPQVSDDEVVDTLQVAKSFDELYFAIRAHEAAIKARIEQARANAAASAQPATPEPQASKIKLPTIVVPNFDGNISEFPSWISLFNELVHNSTVLTPIQKFSYLKSYLSGSALKCIETITFTPANYTLAYKSLQDRYSKKRTLASSLMNKLLEFKPLKNDSIHGLRSFLDNFYVIVESIKSLTIINLDEFMLVHLALRVLDQTSSMEFEKEIANKEFPSFKDLVTFIRKKANIMEQMAESQVPASSSSPSSSFKPKPRYTENKHKVLVGTQLSNNDHKLSNQTPRKGVKCYVCEKGPHRLAFCSKFLKYEPSKRFTIVKEMKLCFSCFSTTHASSECKSIYRCRTCGSARHHSLLHSSSGQSTTSSHEEMPATSSVSSPSSVNNNVKFNGVVESCNLGNNQQKSVHTILLGTAVVLIKSKHGQWIPARCVVDPGSQVSIISESLVQRLGLNRKPCSFQITGIGSVGGSRTLGKITCHLSSSQGLNPEPTLYIEAVIMKKITSTLPNQLSSSVLERFENICLADSTYSQRSPELVDIELLLGAEYYPDIILHSVPIIKGMPSAVPSIFGYLLFGKAEMQYTAPEECTSLFISSIDEDISTQLQKFWSLEEVGSPSPIINEDDRFCEEQFRSTHSRDISGRYIVKLPFKNKLSGSNRAKILRLYHSLENRLNKNPTLKKLYTENLQTYLDMDHMELAKSPSSYLLSHHGVYRESSSTTKLRVVFNPNVVDTSGNNLSQVLHVGPKLQLDIQNILVSFRLHPVAITCDVQAMYRCILVAPEDRAVQHIFWRKDSSQEILEYELKTVTFGLPPSPYLAQRVIQQLAHDEKDKFPDAAQVLENSIYVDDIVSGSDDVASAIHLRNQLCALLKAGGFELRKWASSHQEVLADLSSELCETPHPLGSTESVKVLGIQWCPPSDSFRYSVSVNPEMKVSKRSVLSVISSIYDVNGFLSPVIVYLKIFLQKLWLNKEDTWDTPLPDHLHNQWCKLLAELGLLSNVDIPRYILGVRGSPVQLVGFADASHNAYAAVVYLRVAQSPVQVNLVRAKTKVAPLKVQTINRLELCAALLLAKVINSLSFLIEKLAITDIYLFSDSKTVLSWLRTQPHLLKTFVANRVVQILEWTDPAHWHHVSSENNSADSASRGLTPSQLLENQLWFHGPAFLLLEPEHWKLTWSALPADSLPELKSTDPVVLTVQTPTDFIDVINKYSSLCTLQRVVGFVLRFIFNLKHPNQRVQGKTLTVKELDNSLDVCIKLSQSVYLAEDLNLVAKGRQCSPTLRSLSPLINSRGLLVVGGRLANAAIPEDAKHPIVLSKQCHLTYLIIQWYHLLTLHGGPKLVQSLIHRKYWIINSRNVIRLVLSKCVACTKLKAHTIQPIMADLPVSRVTQGRPFLNVGIDFGGPFSYKTGPRRNSPIDKCYMALFICMATKCIHLELVSSLSTAAFIAALDRFVGRRGLPHCIFSDNGTNFRGASSYLENIQRFLRESHPEITKHLLTQGVTWSFIPPSAPNFGGLWEAGIKSAKHHLKHVLHEQALNFEEFTTLLVRIEAILNSRPLCRLSSSPTDGIDYLSPGHFLTGAPLLARPDHEDVGSPLTVHQRWKLISQASNCFWKKWSRDYINTQMQRSKWTKSSHQLQVGDVVLIQAQATPPQAWPLGRIISLLPGKDQVVRVVGVRTQQGELIRPVSKLVPLPVS